MPPEVEGMWERTFPVVSAEQRGAWETSMTVWPKLLASRFKQINVLILLENPASLPSHGQPNHLILHSVPTHLQR